MNVHDMIQRRVGLPVQRIVLGEPDIEPGVPFAIYRSPNPAIDDLTIDRPTVSHLSIQPHFDTRSGETTERERRDLTTDRAIFAAAGVRQMERGARVNLPDGEWLVDVSESTWGERVKLALARRTLAAMKEMRDADEV